MSTPVSFDRTGNSTIDRILSAVEGAGKCYHNVNEWCEEDDWRGGKSLEDTISTVAKEAADEIELLQVALMHLRPYAESEHDTIRAMGSIARDALAKTSPNVDGEKS